MLRECLQIERAIRESEEEMDRVDPRRRIAMYVDEWGSWYRTEEGHPGYCALPAELDPRRGAGRPHVPHLSRAQRPREDGQHRPDGERAAGDDPHRRREDAAHADLPCVRDVQGASRRDALAGAICCRPTTSSDGRSMPALSVSASRDEEGVVHVSIVNAHAKEAVDARLRAAEVSRRRALPAASSLPKSSTRTTRSTSRSA